MRGAVIVKALSSATIAFAVLEIGLRIVPGAIPLGLLKYYEDSTRLEIAQRRGLPNLSQVWALPRDDDGPELRIFKPYSSLRLPQRDEGAVELTERDANGFCNPLPDGGYGAPKIDIVTIGDSFTVCTAVEAEATWTHQLAGISGRPTYNLGRGGVGTYEYLQILKHFGLQKKPDVVVMNVYEGNDLRDAARYWGHADPSRLGDVAALDRRTNAPVDNFLGAHSYAFNFVAVALAKGWREGARALDRVLGRGAPSERNFRYRVRLADGDASFNDTNMDTEEIEFAVALLEGRADLGIFDAALESFVELAAEHGFTPVVAYSPSAHTVYAADVVFEDPGIAAPLAAYSRALRSYLAESAEKLGFRFVDATPAMQAAAAGNRKADLLYFPQILHYTPAGHRVLAEEVGRALEAAPYAGP